MAIVTDVCFWRECWECASHFVVVVNDMFGSRWKSVPRPNALFFGTHCEDHSKIVMSWMNTRESAEEEILPLHTVLDIFGGGPDVDEPYIATR